MKLLLILLFVGVCACAELPPPPVAPPYYHSKLDLDKAAQKLEEHVLSMKKGIPDLTDYRRHYAEIVYVIYGFGLDGWNGIPPFPEAYIQEVSKYAPQALSEPQKVIDGVQKLIDDFNKKTKLIQEVVKKSCPVLHKPCDFIIQKAIELAGEPLKTQAKLLLAGGEAAAAYLKKEKEFLTVAKDHAAHQYVVDGVNKLEDPIVKLAYLIRLMNISHV